MDGSIPSSEAFAPELVPPQTDEVSKKLRGGVWERSEVARAAYAAVLGLGRWLSRHGVTPNSLTYAALSLALASGVAAAGGYYLIAALCLLVRHQWAVCGWFFLTWKYEITEIEHSV